MLNGWTRYPEKSRRIRSITRELMQAKEGRDSRFHAVRTLNFKIIPGLVKQFDLKGNEQVCIYESTKLHSHP